MSCLGCYHGHGEQDNSATDAVFSDNSTTDNLKFETTRRHSVRQFADTFKHDYYAASLYKKQRIGNTLEAQS